MTKYLWAILLILLPPITIEASSHRIGFQAMTGYNSSPNDGLVDRYYGIMTNVGFVYEWQYGHFLLQTGLSGDYTYNMLKNELYMGEFPDMVDSDGDVCTYQYALNDKSDKIHTFNIVPHFMIGGQWRMLYLLAGLRAHINLYGHAETDCSLQTMGAYENLIAPLENMHNHSYLSSYPLSNNRNMKEIGYKGNISAIGEFGVEFPRNRYSSITSSRTIHRLSIFVEYGLVNICSQTVDALVDFHLRNNNISEINFKQITVQPSFFSNVLPWKSIHPLSIGIKWTVLFEIGRTSSCNCSHVYW